jgi:phenylacetic acid degradation operon negative regulatory protein
MNKNKTEKNFSMAKSILAALWDIKESDTDIIFDHKYMRTFGWCKSPKTFRSAISRLKKAGYIKRGGFNIISLANKGKSEARQAYISAELRLYKHGQTQWDGGWRIILFDIPENKRRHRDYLRNTIKFIGFKELQKSVWVSPYPLPSFLKEILFDENIKPHVRFITTDSIENDGDLKEYFEV